VFQGRVVESKGAGRFLTDLLTEQMAKASPAVSPYAPLTKYAILHVNEPISAKVARPAGDGGCC
jgi:hypothetical protein